MSRQGAAVIEQQPATVETPAAPATPSYSERVDAVLKQGGEAAKAYRLTGKLPEPPVTPETPADQTAESAPAPSVTDKPVKTEAASEPAEDEEQPQAGETPQQKSERKQRNDYKRYIREKVRAELLEKQLAELKAASAPASSPEKREDTPKPMERPKRPRLTDAKYKDDDGTQYEADMDKYEEDREAYEAQRYRSEQSQEFSKRESHQRWAQSIEAGKKEFPDFEAVAFSDKVPASEAMIAVLQGMDNGHRIAYWLGKNIAEADRIAKATHIDGLANLRKSNPEKAAYEWGRMSGIVHAEFSRIDTSKLTAAKVPQRPQKPLKDVIAAAPEPSAEVEVDGGASPVADPVADALKRGDFAAYKAMQNKRDLEARGIRR